MNKSSTGKGERSALRALMLDAAAIIPYYTGHLCAALNGSETAAAPVQVSLASVDYYLDRGFFRRLGVQPEAVLLDCASGLSALPSFVRRSLKLAEYCVNLAALAIRCALRRPDVVHIQFLPLLNSALPVEKPFLACMHRLKIPVIYTVHNVLPQDTGLRFFDLYQSVYRDASLLICHDESTAQRLISEFGIAPEKIRTIPHGTLFAAEDRRSRAEARQRLHLDPNVPIVLWQGILRPYKGVCDLLQAWRILLDQHSDFRGRLLVVGTGAPELIEEIRGLHSEWNLKDSVQLNLQFVSVDEMSDYYSAADLLVYPYREVTGSGALMTGIGFERAVLATRLPAFEAVLSDCDDAILVEPGDIRELALQLGRLLNDESLRNALASKLAENACRLPAWSSIAERTIACYRSVVSKSQAAHPVSLASEVETLRNLS